MSFPSEVIKRFIAGRYPILYLVSWEEGRVERIVGFLGSCLFPISTTMREEISKLERWAFNRAVKASK